MTGLHESTLALSVYNAIARVGSLTPAQAHEHLRSFWRSDVEPSEVFDGIAYLKTRLMVQQHSGAVIPLRTVRGGKPHPLRRSEVDRRELVYL